MDEQPQAALKDRLDGAQAGLEHVQRRLTGMSPVLSQDAEMLHQLQLGSSRTALQGHSLGPNPCLCLTCLTRFSFPLGPMGMTVVMRERPSTSELPTAKLCTL